MRRNPTPAITPQMYRHFATVTIVLTAATAFFANGEKDQAAAADASRSRAAAQAHLVHTAKPQLRVSNETENDDTGTWGSDDSDGFGTPTTQSSSHTSIWAPPPLAPGMAARHVNDSDVDQDPLKTSAGPVGPTPAQIAAAAAASRLRSGSASTD